MRCLILAAGYATRLYPLTKNSPKPLLEVGGKSILDHLIDDMESINSEDRTPNNADYRYSISEYIVVTNHRFADIFTEWADKHTLPITIVDDGTNTNETRLGAVCDIQYAIDELGIDDDLLIIAGDNLLDFSLQTFISYAAGKQTSCTMRYSEPDINRLRKSGISEIDDNDVLISLEEKPENPRSNWCTPPFYYYIREDVKKIKAAITDGCGTDAPGSLAAWMCRHSTVHSMLMPGRRYDIGNLESYEQVNKLYMKN